MFSRSDRGDEARSFAQSPSPAACRKELEKFLHSAFSIDGLRRLTQNNEEELRDSQLAVNWNGSILDVTEKFLDVIEEQGLIESLFPILERERPLKVDEIRRIRAVCESTPPIRQQDVGTITAQDPASGSSEARELYRGSPPRNPLRKTVAAVLIGATVLIVAGLAFVYSKDPLPATSRDVLSVAYQSSPIGTRGKNVGLKVDILVHRDGDSNPQWTEDGEALRSGKDQYFINAETIEPGYLYAFQIDSKGEVDWLFPKNSSPFSAGANPVPKGTVRIPAEDFFDLDDTLGYEHIYLVFSAVEWTALEKTLVRATQLAHPSSAERPLATTHGIRGIVQSPLGLGVRGVGSRRPLAPSTEGPRTIPLAMVESHDGIVVIEKFFEHVSR